MASSSKATVTLSQIAELAGVSPSAVSNWRRRFKTTFPQPVEATAGGRDLFALDEAEEWLRANKRLDPERTKELLVFEAGNMMRGQAGADESLEILAVAIAFAEALDRVGGNPKQSAVRDLVRLVEKSDQSLADVFKPLDELEPVAASRLLEIARRLKRSERAEMFEWVLGRRDRFVESRTSDQLVSLIARLGAKARSVLDPAVGEGGFLAAIAQMTPQHLALYGQEINEAASRIAKLRFLLRGIEADLRRGDSLRGDAFPDLRVAAVLCDPPYGATNPLSAADMTEGRWSFGFVNPKSADFVWLQHVMHHLADDGRGYVLLPAGTMFRRGRDGDLRAEMIRRGAVEAVVSLPAGSAQHTGIPLALWVVRRPGVTADRPVLLVDAAGAESTTDRLTLGPDLIDRIIEVLTTWQRSGNFDEKHRDFAAAVPVLELLGTDANLVPSRWVHRETVGDPRKALAAASQRFAAARSALMAQPNNVTATAASGVNWIPVRKLVEEGVAEIIRGARIKPDDGPSTGVRVLRTRDVRENILDEDPSYVDLDQMKPRPALTEPGDIIVSPASGKLRALVDEQGGHVLASPLQGLRFRADWLDPHVAAAFLESPSNRRFATGTTYGYARVDLQNLELPVIPAEEARSLREALDQLTATQQSAQELAASTRDVREAVLGLAGSIQTSQ